MVGALHELEGTALPSESFHSRASFKPSMCSSPNAMVGEDMINLLKFLTNNLRKLVSHAQLLSELMIFSFATSMEGTGVEKVNTISAADKPTFVIYSEATDANFYQKFCRGNSEESAFDIWCYLFAASVVKKIVQRFAIQQSHYIINHNPASNMKTIKHGSESKKNCKSNFYPQEQKFVNLNRNGFLKLSFIQRWILVTHFRILVNLARISSLICSSNLVVKSLSKSSDNKDGGRVMFGSAILLNFHYHWTKAMSLAKLFETDVVENRAILEEDLLRISLLEFLYSVILDKILGCILGITVYINRDCILDLVYEMCRYTIFIIDDYIFWLMGWPAGLKLNQYLSNFMGIMFLWVSSVYNWSVMYSKPVLECLIIVSVLASIVFGASTTISLFLDMFAALGMNIKISYLISSRLFNSLRKVAISLFHLFRGRKWNVLRQRMDSVEYEADQLLLGTVLFSIVVFILPTVSVYYILFSIVGMLWSLVFYTLGQLCLVIINFLPVYSLACSIFSNGFGLSYSRIRVNLHLESSSPNLLTEFRNQLLDKFGPFRCLPVIEVMPSSTLELLSPLMLKIKNILSTVLSLKILRFLLIGEFFTLNYNADDFSDLDPVSIRRFISSIK